MLFAPEIAPGRHGGRLKNDPYQTEREKGAGLRRPFRSRSVLVLSDDRAFANRGFADGGAASGAQESEHGDGSEQTLLHWDSPLSRVSNRKLKALCQAH